MLSQIIICRCPYENCSCLSIVKKTEGSKLIKNGKVIYPKPPKNMRDIEPTKTYIEKLGLAQRKFIFSSNETGLDINNFQLFDGVYLNEELIQLGPTTVEQIALYLSDHYRIHCYPSNDLKSTIFYTYLPTNIQVLALKPYGYINPNTNPPHAIKAVINDNNLSILIESDRSNSNRSIVKSSDKSSIDSDALFSLVQSIREITREEIRKIQTST